MTEKVRNNERETKKNNESVSKGVLDFFRNIIGKNQKDYPDYIKVAVDWWADAILDDKTFSEKQIDCFKRTLAKQIMREMKRVHYCYLRGDYYPNHALSIAGKKIGVNSKSGYPFKTTMEICENEVIVSAGYQAKYETLWTK